MKSNKKMDGVAHARIQQALQIAPQSLDDLSLVCGFSKAAVTRHMRGLSEAGMVHVADWRRAPSGFGRRIALFTWGGGVNAPKPPCLTDVERMRKHREKRA